jgi:hypothetical protein
MGDNIYIDDNLNCFDEPMASRPMTENFNSDIQIDIPDNEITRCIPPILEDNDSISTS